MKPNPIQPDDRDELARLLPELVERDLPSGRQRQLQEFVMSQIHRDLSTPEQAPRRVLKRRLVLVTSGMAVLGVAAAALVAIGDPGGGQGNRDTRVENGLSPVAQTFELAAAYAATRPFTPPRPDQWIYIQNRELAPSSLAKDKGQDPDLTVPTWKRADGKRMAGINVDSHRLETWAQANEYPALAALPTDPRVLVDLLRQQLVDDWTNGVLRRSDGSGAQSESARTPEEWNALLFRRIATILDGYLLPPAVTAALWRAAALVPGVSQESGTFKVGGREVIAVGRIQEGWRFEQLLLDPNTHDFVGYRSVAVKDHVWYPAGPNGGEVREKKGQVQFTTTRLAAKIVDAAGRTR